MMETHLGKITITPGTIRKPNNPQIKKLKRAKKAAKKNFEKACRTKISATEKLREYYDTQRKLRETLEKYERERIEKITDEISRKGGTNSREFWKIRKRIVKPPNQQYDLITEDGHKIMDSTKHRNYIADYFEELYQAREGSKEYENWTSHIKKMVRTLETIMENKQHEYPLTIEELNKAIRSLKTNKSPGPDTIPNEIFIKATRNARHFYLRMFNKILIQETIPDQWLSGNITRLYKGKGTKGKCSNERGITLASNVGKLFERMVNNRATPMVNMTDAQAGGIRGRATTDHLLTLKEAINIAKSQRKQVYATFLDVTKAYDKAWIDAIMYVMYKRGLNTKIWSTIKKLNENFTATIQTKYGPTRKIKIKDSIRQGGVISVLQYALLMDEINKEIQGTDLGIKIPNTETNIACLLWMDDVLLLETRPEEKQELLNITNKMVEKYHIKFGREKSQTMIIGNTKERPQFTLGQMTLDPTTTYKYLWGNDKW